MSETDKSAALLKAVKHLCHVQAEQSFCKTTCDLCKTSVHALFFSNGTLFDPPPLASSIADNSNHIKARCSFDLAQQIHYPSNPLQPQPIYFLTPRKCSIVGVHCEAIPRQVNFFDQWSWWLWKGVKFCDKHASIIFLQSCSWWNGSILTCR